MLNKITQLLANPNLTTYNRKALEKLMVQYKAPGGEIPDDYTGTPNLRPDAQIYQKVQQAKAAGVPQEDIDRVLRNNAMKARDASVRSALLRGGLSGLQQSSANQAGLITQAGLGNQAFTPGTSGLGAVGQGIVEAGAAEKNYQEKLSEIEKDKLDRESKELEKEQNKEKSLKEETNSIKRIIELAASAHNLVNTAVPALTVAQSVANSKFLKGVSIAAIAKGGDAGAVKELVHTFILPAVREEVNAGTITQESEAAYTKMVADITDITTVALKAQGPGPKTDFDFIVAARATANLESTAATIKSSMKRMIDNANNALKRALQPMIIPQLDESPPSTFEYSFANSAAGRYLDDIKNETNQVIDNTAESAGSFIEGITGSGTKDSPYLIPVTVGATVFNKNSKSYYEKVLEWLEKKDLPDNSYISFKEEVGTVKELVDKIVELLEQ